MIEKILGRIGLSEKEVSVYLALVKLGSTPASRVAREVELPRQTVYTILQHLVESGLVEQGVRSGTKRFLADPQRLPLIIDKRKREIDEQNELLKKEIPKLLSLNRQRESFPKIQYYEGEKGLKHLFENILDQYKKGETEVFRGYGVNTIRGLLHGYIPDFLKERHELGVETHLFIGRGDDDFSMTDRGNALGRTVKRLDMDPAKAGMYLVGDRVYLFSYADLVGVMIENEALATLLKNTFDTHWSVYREQK
jgi:predicted transcriptional regulator